MWPVRIILATGVESTAAIAAAAGCNLDVALDDAA